MTASLHAAQPGDALPGVDFGRISRTRLALYAGASGDHNQIHIDSDFAKKAGMPDVFAHGMLSMGVLARVVSDWAGVEKIVSLSARFLAITPVNARLVCGGQVTERLDLNGEPHLRIALSAEITTAEGQSAKTLAGEAVVRVARAA
jgi:acyl dehydratase